MAVTQASLESSAAGLGQELVRRGWKLAVAESCTGGWAAQAITAVSGSSAWFDRGFVTYSNEAKMDMLDVGMETLSRHGAVSEETVREMAQGALRHSRARAAFAISGIAGPTGGSPGKPVGTVCFAFVVAGSPVTSDTAHFQGDRRSIRMQSVDYAFRHMLNRLSAMP